MMMLQIHTTSFQIVIHYFVFCANIYLVANWRQNYDYDKNENVMSQLQLIFKL